MPSFSVEKTKGFSSDSTPEKKSLSVEGKIYLDFSECTIKDSPSEKRDFKEIVSALSSFQSQDTLKARTNHKLTKKDIGANSERIEQFIDQYKNVWSIDVYHRNSSKGNYRLLYYPDFDNIRIAHVLDCFIDTH
ncbi:MAG: hypothetical protein J6X78_02745 [Treponema sp.]|nr:hypothetical protein [Treponema sp.]